MSEYQNTYNYRAGIRSKPASLVVTDGRLIAQEEGKQDACWNLSDITQVNLRYDPTRFCRNRFRMMLQNTAGNGLTVSNVSFKGFADFDDQSDTYRQFVSTLHAALLAQGAQTRFLGGLSRTSYWLHWILTGVAAIAVVMASLAFFALGLSWLILIKVALIAFYFPTLLAFMRRSRPTNYAADAIPERLLPSPASQQE
ncbi:MAG: hypothetical protein ABJM29_00035 [Rhizobiaceae bacterium]